MRRQKIVGDTTSRNNFSRKLYLGLERRKKRHEEPLDPQKPDGGRMMEMRVEESSSEEEFVEEPLVASKKRSKSQAQGCVARRDAIRGQRKFWRLIERSSAIQEKEEVEQAKEQVSSRRRRSELSDDKSSSDSGEERRGGDENARSVER